MISFKDYIALKKVKVGSPDLAQALSLFRQAKLRLQDVEQLSITLENASFRFEDMYESVREAIQAFMAREGYKPYSHEAVVAFANEKNLLNESELATLNRYRIIRHDITYRAQTTTVEETTEALSFSQRVIKKLEKVFTEP